MKNIKRKKYLKKIQPFIGKELIKVLVGARRVGKTYILLQLMKIIKEQDKNANIIHIDKESPKFANLQNGNDLYAYAASKSQKHKNNYVFIDEIQDIENFETGLRYLFSDGYDIYITGSNARLLSSDLATYLSGRYIEIEIFPLDFSEFLEFHNLPPNMESLTKYIKFGGLPFLINLDLQDEIVYNYLQSVYNTIILKDVVKRHKIKELDFLERLVEFLTDNEANLLSAKRIVDFLKSQQIRVSVNTVNNYLAFLEQAFFIKKIKRYDIHGRKVFEINEKYYFSDLGLKHSIRAYSPDNINAVLENLVANRLLSEGYKVFVGKFKDKEIDFIAQKGSSIKYFQVAYSLGEQSVLDREFGNLLKIKDNYPKYVISADTLISGSFKGIEHINILEFLTSFEL